ncbi:MAG: hypothetical protein ABGW77_03970 [Campylobacterales bacterium]
MSRGALFRRIIGRIGIGGVVLTFWGCSNQPHFQPELVYPRHLKSWSSPFLYDYTYQTKTFRAGTLFFKPLFYNRKGEELGEFRMVGPGLAGKGNRLKVLETGKVYTLPAPVLRATRHRELVAFLLTNNGYGVLNLSTGEITFYQTGEQQFAGNYLGTAPLFYQQLIFFPLLSGDVVAYDLKSGRVLNRFVVSTSNSPFLNSILYLAVIDDSLYAATPTRIILFAPHYFYDQTLPIKHILQYNKNLYIFTREGEILKFKPGLIREKSQKLKFAQLIAPTICNQKIYTVERYTGYLIEIDPESLEYLVFDGPKLDLRDPIRLEGCKIYNGPRVYSLE